MTDPWRDPENYKSGRIIRCLGCNNDCHKTHWGNWCFKCNVERIDRINRQFEPVAKALGMPALSSR